MDARSLENGQGTALAGGEAVKLFAFAADAPRFVRLPGEGGVQASAARGLKSV